MKINNLQTTGTKNKKKIIRGEERAFNRVAYDNLSQKNHLFRLRRRLNLKRKNISIKVTAEGCLPGILWK